MNKELECRKPISEKLIWRPVDRRDPWNAVSRKGRWEKSAYRRNILMTLAYEDGEPYYGAMNIDLLPPVPSGFEPPYHGACRYWSEESGGQL